ncbi:MAG: GNAT family N-acetyltransferase [Bacilli bacterium]|nr:GNAT family N-acetyltransferase [Bacilli bacterium]
MKKLFLYIPKLEDLWFREQMLSDEETMSYNHKWGGTIDFPKTKWNDWYSYWVKTIGNNRLYRYLVNDNGDFIGEIAYHKDEDTNYYMTNIIIYSKYRNLGYGRIGLGLLIDIAKENGITELYDDIAIDNKAIKLFIDFGFYEIYRTDDIIMMKKDL